MERHEIETFLTLAEELHFGRTTERLGLSQGRVSQTIKKLERRFGTLLFERTSRHVALTPIGERLRDDLLPAHQQIQHAIERTAAAGRGITATLRIGYFAPWCGDLMMQAGEAFRDRHPGCAVHVQEIALSDPLGPLRAGKLDLQLAAMPVDEPGITTGPILFSEPRTLVVPAAHPLAQQETVSLEDLARIPRMTLTGDIPQYWLDAHFPPRTPTGRPIPPGPSTTSWQGALLLIAAGKGALPTSRRATDYYSRPSVVVVPFSDAPPLDYGLVWPTAQETTFIRELAEITASLVPGR
jgi:DNA-binding transcriptional LysR family regulator